MPESESARCVRESVACRMGTKGRLVAAEIRKINCMSNFQWQPSFNMVHGQELRSYASDTDTDHDVS